MDIKSISFEKPSLLWLADNKVDLAEPSFDPVVRKLLETNTATHVNVVVVKTADTTTLYASFEGKAHKANIGDDQGPLCVLILTPAKGPGFVDIGQGWSHPFLRFGERYGELELNEARDVARKLESLLNYELSDVQYGADF